MRFLTLLLLTILSSHGLYSQSYDNLSSEDKKRAILILKECFEELSEPKPHYETYTLYNGKTVKALVQTDFKRSVFTTVDEFLEDVKLWQNSPYFWKMRHSKKGKTIMDAQDLSKWEINNFKTISDSYFSEGTETFHIAAHGLLHENGEVANRIKIGGQELDAKETADFIIQSMKGQFHHVINAMEKPFTIVVHSCHSAEGENNFTQQLSKYLVDNAINNVYVVGAPDVVYCTEDTSGYTEVVAPINEAYLAMNGGPAPKTNLPWKVYKDGKNMPLGSVDWKESVRQIQAEK